MKMIVTGGAGFIGSALIRYLLSETGASVVNIDKLTYAANLSSLDGVAGDPRYQFERIDICDGARIRDALRRHQPEAIVNLAAETHVDRSIDAPAAFIQTNIVGTHVLLEMTLEYWRALDGERRRAFRFLHVSTDEVFGSLGATGRFSETTPYRPTSPYSASKASADHLVRAWHHTYGLPVVMSNCSNNYGPYQFPEKLVPLMILNAIERRPLPVYGRGENVRDWLYVDDHARALWLALGRGRVGESYNIGGDGERANLEVVELICDLVDELRPDGQSTPRRSLIEFVADRPGHDLRYAIDASKARTELDWAASESVESGLRKTIEWYLDNEAWWGPIRRDVYAGERLGSGAAAGSS